MASSGVNSCRKTRTVLPQITLQSRRVGEWPWRLVGERARARSAGEGCHAAERLQISHKLEDDSLRVRVRVRVRVR
jgi:hypothetical protein